jgi:hypothetical protein
VISGILKNINEFLSPKVKSGSNPTEQKCQLTLGNGGKVTLLVDVDPFSLSKTDSEFVRKLIDSFREYNKEETR